VFYTIFREEVEECAKRELLEETGLKLKNVSVDGLLNAVWTSADNHFITILVRAELDEEHQLEPVTAEPDKCQGCIFVILVKHCS
jgi:8-oxo-dGTP diphosphatase